MLPTHPTTPEGVSTTVARQSPRQGVNQFAKLAPDSAALINSYLPPSTVALTAGVSKSFRVLSDSTFNSLAYTRTIYYFLNCEGICGTLLFGALSMRNPPARTFFQSMSEYRKLVNQIWSTRTDGMENSELIQLFNNSLVVALSLQEWALKSQLGTAGWQNWNRKSFVDTQVVQQVKNLQENCSCGPLTILQHHGKISTADAMLFTERGRKNIESPGVYSAFSNRQLSIRQVLEMDQATASQYSTNLFLPMLEQIAKFTHEKS